MRKLVKLIMEVGFDSEQHVQLYILVRIHPRPSVLVRRRPRSCTDELLPAVATRQMS